MGLPRVPIASGRNRFPIDVRGELITNALSDNAQSRKTQMLGKRRESLTTQLVREIVERIDAGSYAAGAKLPTEQELINEFGVSRTVVREAISNLKASGLVSTHQGIGAFVLENPPPPAFRIATDNMQLIEEVISGLELRLGIELEAAALGAQRRTEADLGAMEAAPPCTGQSKPAKAISKPTSTSTAPLREAPKTAISSIFSIIWEKSSSRALEFQRTGWAR